MSTKKTLKGKPCKLCLKKGGPCHIHGGKSDKTVKATTKVTKKTSKSVPKESVAATKKTTTKAPKRKVSTTKTKTSSKMKSGKSVPVLDMAVMPRDVLRLLLLEMDRPELTKIRKMSKRAREMSNTDNFKSEYLAKHYPTFFTGPVDIRPQHRRYDDKNYAEKYIIRDSDGHTVLVAGIHMDVEDENGGVMEDKMFIIHWIGYSNTPVSGPKVSAKSKTSVVPFAKLKEGFKHISFRTNSQALRSIISETIDIIADEYGPQSTRVILAEH